LPPWVGKRYPQREETRREHRGGCHFLTSCAGEPLDEALVGLLVAGLVFGVGIAAVDWLVTNPRYVSQPFVYVGQALRAAARIVGAGSFGALSGLVARRDE